MELGEIDVEWHALDAVGLELDGGDAPVECRTIVLQTRRHVDRSRLDVHGDLQQPLGIVVRALPLGECRAHGHVEGRRSGDTRAGRRLRGRRQRDAPRLEEVHEERQQPQFLAVPQLSPVICLERSARVLRADHDARIVARLERRGRADADRGIECLCAGMK